MIMKPKASPFESFKAECTMLLEEALREEGMAPLGDLARLSVPSDPSLGDLSLSTFGMAKAMRQDPRSIASRLAGRASGKGRLLVSRVEAAGGGYVNFFIDAARFAELTVGAVIEGGARYGWLDPDGERVIVEHTSVNPIHPIHIGGARNAIIGDCLARILEATGKDVRRHFYIDDVGLQVAQASYGYSKAGGAAAMGTAAGGGAAKGDHFIGFIYATTSCAMNIKRLKADVARLKAEGRDEEALKGIKELDDWVSAANDLRAKNGPVFDRVFDAVSSSPDPDGEVAELLKRYEGREKEAVELIRGLCETAITGFKETLGRVGVNFDSWDWESELASWSGGAEEAVRRLSETEFAEVEEGTTILNAEKVVAKFGLKEKYSLRQEVPPLTLKRSDGTTLYTTRDLAYTLWKFGRADRVINVISIEQKLPQLQLKLALYALGRGDLADRLVHFSYELVHLPGYKMSGRRGRYVAFDDVLNESVERAYSEVSTKSPHLSEEERRRISELVGIGSVRYAMIAVASNKPITFTWDRVLNFEQNSAPFIQYAHARACNILAKTGDGGASCGMDYAALASTYERDVVVKLAVFPDIMEDAGRSLRPEAVADYANDLASKFNHFYDNVPVLKTESAPARNARLRLVEAVKIVLENALSVIGIEAPSRM